MQRESNRRGGNRGDNRRQGRLDKDGRKKRKKACLFCANLMLPDYKNIDLMRKFLTERGKIMTQRTSGCCAAHQRNLAIQIKRARQIGFVTYTAD